MKKRSDNRGFTLVEIIIAVAILAIAITPLVANFIQSSNLNLKGRQTLNAMNLAQDMMEGISGSTAEDVQAVIENYINDPDAAQSLVGTVFPVSTTFEDAVKTSADGDEILVYKFTKVKTIDSPKNEYSVQMTMNPTGAEHEDFNGKDLADISEINQYYDAIYTWEETEIDSVVNEMFNAATITSYSVSDYYGKIYRTIRIKIVNSGTEAAPKYKVSVIREYSPTGELAVNAGLDSSFVVKRTTENISRVEENIMPRNIYLYYQGMINSTYNSRYDTIEIDSSTGEEITVYLVRTQKESDSTKVAYGLLYGCDVKITSTDMMGVNTQDVHIVSNLRYDLNAVNMRYNFRDVDESGAAIPEDEIDYPTDDNGTPVTVSSYERNRARYYYNGMQIDEALYQSNFTAGYAKKEKNTLYKVLIEVFDENGKKVATYDGGLSN